MFKLSDPRYPEQYWSEVIAFAIGQLMGVPVPPAYPAIDSTRGESAALIEWFYEDGVVSSILGGRFMERMIPGFDSRRGKQHNFKSIRALFHALQKRSLLQDPNWLEAWTKGLMFDAMIGNTDRHQNNWALILNQGLQIYELAPWFDNGTSLGHERWERSNPKRCGFFELPDLLLTLDPTLREPMLGCVLAIDIGKLEEFMQRCTSLQCTVPLSPWRAKFMLRMVKRRQALFLEQLS